MLINNHNNLKYKTDSLVRDGILNNALFIPSINYNSRPECQDINLLVIHCASLPEGEYNNNNLEKLFAGSLSAYELKQLSLPPDLEVSTHVYINRTGSLMQFVAFDKRAWHAGVSCHEGISNCNNFSIGIELQGTTDSEFTVAQYDALINVTKAILNAYPLITKDRIVGHSDIAPLRKVDPGVMFDWNYYLSKL